MGFLGVYRAVYDYVPQGESELAITEGDTLYVLEKSGEDDWWKAKKKASGDEDDEPEGLIPNNYVEEAHPTHSARALYDYTRQTDEELSFTEDAKLEVFDTSDPDWILVGLDGEYGFVPANYIELQDEVEAQEPEAPAPTPALPRRPTVVEEPEPESPPAQTPAAAIAGIMSARQPTGMPLPPRQPQYTPDASDEEPPTPTLPARPVSQMPAPEVYSPRSPISPGPLASPPYNRASQRGMDDHVAARAPTGFHLYNISEMVSVMGKRKKMPTTLGINSATGEIMIAPEKERDGPEQKWTAEKLTHYSIEGKHVFMELVRPSKSLDLHAGAKDTAQEIVAALGDLAGAVRLGGGLREVYDAVNGQGQKKGQVLYDFMAQGDDEVTVAVGDEVYVLDDTKSEEWWQVRRLKNGKEGVVPSSYIEITGTVQTSSSIGLNAGRSVIEQNRLEEERLAKESLKAARREEERGSEVGPGMKLPERGSSLSVQNGNNSGQQHRNGRSDGGSRTKSKPDPAKVRTWTDRSDTFSVEAQFLALKDGKFNLHKLNGVKIAVPIVKMSLADLEYVEKLTGVSLDEDKPLSAVKKQRQAKQESSPSTPTAGATIERSQKPEYDWFQFFLSCDVAVGLCERYAQAFSRDSMDESVLPDIDAVVLRTLGLREGDIIKVMRFLDKKYNRQGGKRSVSFGGEEVMDGESAGGLFSGPGGTLRNNTRKGRPAPAIQTNDIVDPKAFSQDSPAASKPEGVATPLATAPVPAQKDVPRSGFDDDAWDVKPARSQPAAEAPKPAAPAAQPTPPPPQQPSLTGSMQELSLLSQPLEPAKVQPPPPQPQVTQPPPPQAPQQVPQLTGATPSFFTGIGNQQTGLPQQQTNNSQFQPSMNFAQQQQQANIARQRPAPPQFNQGSGGLLPPLPPSRPLSAPQNQSAFAPPPLQPQMTGIQNSSGYQPQIAPPGQSLNDLTAQRLQQQYTAQQQQMQPQMTGFGGQMMPQPTGFNQFTGQQPNGFQPQPFQPQQTGFQPNFMNGQGQNQQFSAIQPQPTGFTSSFPQQQFPQATGVNSFLPPPLQPQQTGAMQPQQTGMNGFGGQSFGQPPQPTQQQAPAPLVPQQTGPPPPVRFGVTGDTKKLMPQATGRRANLAQATPQNPFGF
ncbi:hypothetical protein BP6252_00174 [Coleophoma cylindrospora]|uniref:Actin cytoskeleton-regulatory complex protein SLA1 n=1 Tax=Coleophoma cylindrospora TaxID=1849047 RepID=A0A3D8SPC1_9HELO|nr:hypothetical protein BP6252_00174 [Coleophoma cylindrospora]